MSGHCLRSVCEMVIKNETLIIRLQEMEMFEIIQLYNCGIDHWQAFPGISTDFNFVHSGILLSVGTSSEHYIIIQ